MPRTNKEWLDGLVGNSKYDYVSLWQIINAANEARDADPSLDRIQRTLALLGQLLDRGFLAVDLTQDGGCTPWPDQDHASVLRRIETEWRRTNDEPGVGSVFWFDRPQSRR